MVGGESGMNDDGIVQESNMENDDDKNTHVWWVGIGHRGDSKEVA